MFHTTAFRRILSLFVGLLLAASLLAPRPAAGQAMLVNVNPEEHVRLPRPMSAWPAWQPHHVVRQNNCYKIKAIEVDARLKDQVAKVQVSQTFVNTGSRVLEASLVFPLPYDGAIDQLTLLIDGKEVSAKLLPKQEARARFEEIVRKNRDPALLEWIGTGMFQTSVFPIPPGGERRVTLRYTQLCRNTDGVTDFLFPLATAKFTTAPAEEINFHLAIESQQPIKNVYSPTRSVDIKRPDDEHAIVDYVAHNEIPASDFRLFYDVGREAVGTSVLSYWPNDAQSDSEKDGYFLLLASPEIKADAERPKKTVVFVLDRSGSMTGEKIEQAKNAIKFVLNNLHEGDLFNIIAFDSEVESWRPELQRFNDKTRRAALGFVEGIFAGGSTNIDGALRTALTQLKDASRPNFVLFMTDGLPTDGEQNESKIVENSHEYNKVRARIFTFGVGFDLNSRLLDRLSGENFGQSEFIRPNENIESTVSALYRRISAPVLSDLKITWAIDSESSEEDEPVNRVYPRAAHDLFAGEQLILVGRYRHAGAAKVTLSGSVDGKPQKFSFPANLVVRGGSENLAFIEKLWATRRIGEILNEIDLKGQNDELVKELVWLSMRHGIITPYTSFLADETTRIGDVEIRKQARAASKRLQSLGQLEGEIGVEQRAANLALSTAPTPAIPSAQPLSLVGGTISVWSAATTSGTPRFSFSRSAGGGQGAAVVGEAAKDAAQADANHVAENVRYVGAKVFYRRGDRWVDSSLSDDQQKNPIKIERFSREYFDLVDHNGRDVARYMAFDEPVIVEIGGKAYAF